MPKLEAFFHYRNIDVSTLKELAKRWRPSCTVRFKKQQKHTALADVHESIDELVYYRTHFLRMNGLGKNPSLCHNRRLRCQRHRDLCISPHTPGILRV
jgi:hypothetical protein